MVYPPDFSIDSRIAVEVRRLNQHFFTENEVQGLEEHQIPLFKLVELCLRNLIRNIVVVAIGYIFDFIAQLVKGTLIKMQSPEPLLIF